MSGEMLDAKNDIRERRKRDDLTQKELANLIGVSHTYLNEIETGRRKASQELLKKIDYFLNLYDPEKKLEILFDYVRIRFPTTDIKYIMEEVLGIRMIYTIREGHAFYGYSAQHVIGDIVVMTSDDEKKGCLMELKGKGCREFEIFLNAQGRTWVDFFRQVQEERGVLKRIDLAINDRAGWLDIRCRKSNPHIIE